MKQTNDIYRFLIILDLILVTILGSIFKYKLIMYENWKPTSYIMKGLMIIAIIKVSSIISNFFIFKFKVLLIMEVMVMIVVLKIEAEQPVKNK